ncbi:unnamed protein product [Amoebophrya sp. A120]|nr:unnamed protein product [Amoebophrya sp. A120]|eukprot:GSA120T00025728001.1
MGLRHLLRAALISEQLVALQGASANENVSDVEQSGTENTGNRGPSRNETEEEKWERRHADNKQKLHTLNATVVKLGNWTSALYSQVVRMTKEGLGEQAAKDLSHAADLTNRVAQQQLDVEELKQKFNDAIQEIEQSRQTHFQDLIGRYLAEELRNGAATSLINKLIDKRVQELFNAQLQKALALVDDRNNGDGVGKNQQIQTG